MITHNHTHITLRAHTWVMYIILILYILCDAYSDYRTDKRVDEIIVTHEKIVARIDTLNARLDNSTLWIWQNSKNGWIKGKK